MVGKMDYSSVPTSAELEGKNKYTVNKDYRSSLVIQRSLCALMAIGALLLAVIAALLVFFLVPRCANANGSKDKPDAVQLPMQDLSNASLSDLEAQFLLLLLNPSLPKGTKDAELPMRDETNNSLSQLDTQEPIFRTEDKDERLPRNIIPKHYRLQIIPFIGNSTMVGTETITLHVEETTSEIIFNIKDLSIDRESVKVTTEQGYQLGIVKQTYMDGDKYRIELNDTLQASDLYYLDFMFTGFLNNELRGLYRSEYRDVNSQTKHLACTQFSPNDARRAFPCFDEPSFKARFSISIGRQTNMTSISNMPLEGKPEPFYAEKGWVWDHYQETPEMSTYLVAFIVSDLLPFKHPNNTNLRTWVQQTSSYRIAYAEMIVPKLLNFYETYTGINYSLPKLDLVAVPDFGFNAMENWGLITFRETALLFDRYMSSIENMRDVALITAHEIAHQWFGNLVTPTWWDDLWLKEGFSTYFQYLGIIVAEPTFDILQEFVPSETAVAFAMDSLKNARPLTQTVISNRQIRQAFDRLPYSKGASLIYMMHNFLGDDVFKSAVRKYLRTYIYKNADTNDLLTVFTEEAKKKHILDNVETVENIMHYWVHQPGFPVVTVDAARGTGTMTLTMFQNRFLYINEKEGREEYWYIPISITTDLDKNFDTTPDIWIKNDTEIKTTIKADKWYLMNINQTGYFIVNYDIDNWNAFKNMGIFMTLPTSSRAHLISDSMELARAGLLDYDIPLTIIGRMGLTDQFIMYVPTLTAMEKLQYLHDMLYSTPAFGQFEKYHNFAFKFAYNAVTFASADIQDYISQRILSLILKWSCRNLESPCAIDSVKLFRELVSTGKEIPQSIRSIVYCTALRHGSIEDWYFAYRRYLDTMSPSEKNVLLDALGCTNQQWLLSSYLDFLKQTNSSIRTQDAVRVFTSVANNYNGYRVAFDFLRGNWQYLIRQYGDGGFNIFGKMIKSIARYFNTEYQLKELIQFRKLVRGKIGPAEYAFDSAIEEVEANIHWMKINYEPVAQWLNVHSTRF